jgi:hypothetical protein
MEDNIKMILGRSKDNCIGVAKDKTLMIGFVVMVCHSVNVSLE